MNAYLHSGSGKVPLTFDIDSFGGPSVAADAAAIGGSIVTYNGSGNRIGNIYPGFDNSTKTGVVSILHRFAPTWSNNPPTSYGLITITGHQSNGVAPVQSLTLLQQSNGHLILEAKDNTGTTCNTTDAGVWAPVSGTYYDFCIVYGGGTAANDLKLYIDGTLFFQTTPTRAWLNGQTPATHSLVNAIILGMGSVGVQQGPVKSNEFILWDDVIDPTSGGLNLNGASRSAFVTVSGTLDPPTAPTPAVPM